MSTAELDLPPEVQFGLDLSYVIIGSCGTVCTVILLSAILKTRSLRKSKEYVLPVVVVVCDLTMVYGILDTGVRRCIRHVARMSNDYTVNRTNLRVNRIADWECFKRVAPHVNLWMPLVIGWINVLLAVDRIYATRNPVRYMETNGSLSMKFSAASGVLVFTLIGAVSFWMGQTAYDTKQARNRFCGSTSIGYRNTVGLWSVTPSMIAFGVCLLASFLQTAKTTPHRSLRYRVRAQRQTNVTKLTMWLGLYFFVCFTVPLGIGVAVEVYMMIWRQNRVRGERNTARNIVRASLSMKQILLVLHVVSNWVFFVWRNPAERSLVLSWITCGRVKKRATTTTAGLPSDKSSAVRMSQMSSNK